jgi:hypothetical protein
MKVKKEISSPKHSWLVQQLLKQSQKEKDKIPSSKIQLEEISLFHAMPDKINFSVLKTTSKYYNSDPNWIKSNYDLSFFQPPELT